MPTPPGTEAGRHNPAKIAVGIPSGQPPTASEAGADDSANSVATM